METRSSPVTTPKNRRFLAGFWLLSLLAAVLLYPGLTQDILAVKLNAHVQAGQLADLKADLVDQQRSILTTVKGLWQSNLVWPAVLIALFSVVFPILKLGLAWALACGIRWSEAARTRCTTALQILGKWSMADVFVVSVLIVFLSADSAERFREDVAVFGFRIQLDVLTQLQAELGPGFYTFAAYCLLAHASTAFLNKALNGKAWS